MSKSDSPLSRIDTSGVTDPMREPAWHGGSPIHAWDTETTEASDDSTGRVFALAVAPDGYDPTVYTAADLDESRRPGDTLPTDGLLKLLTGHRFRRGVNVWYNLSFDGDVIFSGLPEENRRELQRYDRTTYEPADSTVSFEITYVPAKFLRIRDSNGHTYEHYDISGIVRSKNLGAAADEWTEYDGKANDGLDVSRFEDRSYLRRNMGTILSYARRDAVITRAVWRSFVNTAESAGVPAGKPFSTGYLAADYLRDNLSQKPGYGASWVQQYAWDSYAGGRFEIFERGAVGEVVVPDINSAYPAVMAGLPDPSSMAWRHPNEPSLDAVRGADYGFVDVTVTTDPERRIQPFAVKTHDGLRYPSLTDHRLRTLRETFLFALDAGLIEDFTLHSAALAETVEGVTRYPFREDIDVPALYERRKVWGKHEGKPDMALALKIVLNSMYGKTCQTVMHQRPAEPGEDPAELEPHERLSVTYGDGRGTVAGQVAGRFFNPFLAAYITGLTRLKLHRTVVRHGLEGDTIAFATDSIIVRREAFEASGFVEAEVVDASEPGDYAEALGAWGFDARRGDGFVIGSGVYEIAKPSGGFKRSTRGFKELSGESLRAAAETATRSDTPGEIEATNHRPLTLAEVTSGRTGDGGTPLMPGDVGRFIEEARPLRAGFDEGRDWPDPDPTYGDLLAGARYGPPVHVDGGDSRKSEM